MAMAMRLPVLSLIAAALAAPAAGQDLSFLGEFRVTYYWIASEDARFDGLPRTAELRDGEGRRLALVSPAFRREIEREGTGRLRDGRVLNVSSRDASGRWRFHELPPGRVAQGAFGSELVPFHSVAAAASELGPGELLYLPALEGLHLPDGSRHDGRVRVDDRGGAIHAGRLDLFVLTTDHLPRFEACVPSHGATDVYRIVDPPAGAPAFAGGVGGDDPFCAP